MKYSEKISVVVPVYNVEKYLDECVASICGQTYDNLEIILVDDGSTDRSGAICDEWSKKDSRVIALHQQNGGVSKARNYGIEHATGELMGFVDSDDMIMPEMYERLYQRMQEDHTDVAVCAYKTVDEQGNAMEQIYPDVADGVLSFEMYIFKVCENVRAHCELVIVSNKLYKMSIVKELRFRCGVVHEDEFFLTDLLFKTKRFSVISSKLYLYRQRQGSIMHVEFSEKRISYFYALKERLEKCRENHVEEKYLIPMAKECIDLGIRYWLLSDALKLMDKEELNQLYEETREVMAQYGALDNDFKHRIIGVAFKYCPAPLKLIYRFYKRVLKKN